MHSYDSIWVAEEIEDLTERKVHPAWTISSIKGGRVAAIPEEISEAEVDFDWEEEAVRILWWVEEGNEGELILILSSLLLTGSLWGISIF